MIPSPDTVAVALLRADDELAAVHEGRVSTDLLPGGPALRLTLLPGGDPATRWEWRATIQCDAFASDQLVAADLAALVRWRWTNYTGRRLASLGAYVSGCWVVTDPLMLLDDDSRLPRYVLTLGLAVHEG